MPLPSEAFNAPELQELWAMAQETRAVFLNEVKATAEALGTTLDELVDWLTTEGITILPEETEDGEEDAAFLAEPPLEEDEGIEDRDMFEEIEEGDMNEEPLADTALSDPLQVLFQSLRWTRFLTPEEEIALAQRVQQGDLQAREQLIEANLRLVLSIAAEFAKRMVVPLEDLVQEGCLGLIRAVDRYDWRKGVRFSSYAVWWIRQSIVRAVAEHSRIIRLPFHLVEILAQVVATTQRLTQELGRAPTTDELANATGLPAERIEEVLLILPAPLSLETPVDEEEAMVLEDVVPDSQSASPEAAYWRMYAREQLRALLAESLSEREWEVIKLRFGLLDGRSYTLDEISRILKITREGVRHIEERALAKLRRPHYRKLLQQLNELFA